MTVQIVPLSDESEADFESIDSWQSSRGVIIEHQVLVPSPDQFVVDVDPINSDLKIYLFCSYHTKGRRRFPFAIQDRAEVAFTQPIPDRTTTHGNTPLDSILIGVERRPLRIIDLSSALALHIETSSLSNEIAVFPRFNPRVIADFRRNRRVERKGVEPSTFALRTRRSPN